MLRGRPRQQYVPVARVRKKPQEERIIKGRLVNRGVLWPLRLDAQHQGLAQRARLELQVRELDLRAAEVGRENR